MEQRISEKYPFSEGIAPNVGKNQNNMKDETNKKISPILGWYKMLENLLSLSQEPITQGLVIVLDFLLLANTCQAELWKLLDFVKLKHSSISFFDLERHETAMSRWSRARTRAAKVRKDLSKNGKTQKLALQRWLKEIDPRHHYGHNLHFHYVKWLNY